MINANVKNLILNLWFALSFIFLPVFLKCQDTVSFQNIEDPTLHSYIMLNTSFTNNNIDYRLGVSEKMPSLFNNINYFHKSGLYTGVSLSNYFHDSLQSADYDIVLGYQKYFDNGFDFDINYTWHNFSGSSIMQVIDYNHAFDLMSSYEVRNNYFTTDFSMLAGQQGINYFLNFDIIHFITFYNVLNENDVLMINPSISLSFGTDNWVYSDLSSDEQTNVFQSLESMGYSYQNFSYQSINIFVPVSYGIGNFYFSLSGLYRFMGGKFKTLGMASGFGMMASVTCFINFK
jgi:hypothetical protein